MKVRTQRPKSSKRNSFSIDQKPYGFKIVYGPNFPEVTVTRHSTHFSVDWTQDSNVISEKYGLYEFYSLVNCIAEGLIRDWKPSAGGSPLLGLPLWRMNLTARVIGKKVHIEWRRLLEGVDPIVLAVHRSIFAATFRSARIALEPELYKHKYVVSDILNYRGAATAAVIVEALCEGSEEFRINSALPLVNNWRTVFSFTNKTYSSLNKTLMNIPGGVACGVLCHLNKIFLQRPILSRLELILICLYAQNVRRHVFEREEIGGGESVELYASPNENVFMFAASEQIKKAIALLAKHLHCTLSNRRTLHLKFLVRFLLDFPDEHHGNILGLARKSIRWHRDGQAIERQEMLDRLGFGTKTALPPIQWPERPGIKFLSTVDDIAEESEQMQHCVASYAHNAVWGHCYLFHISRNGEQATIEVGRSGRVVQAHGPKNRGNRAAKWGARLLNQWGHNFPEILAPSQALPANPLE